MLSNIPINLRSFYIIYNSIHKITYIIHVTQGRILTGGQFLPTLFFTLRRSKHGPSAGGWSHTIYSPSMFCLPPLLQSWIRPCDCSMGVPPCYSLISIYFRASFVHFLQRELSARLLRTHISHHSINGEFRPDI
jgi:hypothetical protein